MTVHLDRRSIICTPATSTDAYTVAQTCGADVGLVDLEDSVPPQHKQTARVSAAGYFTSAKPACVLAVRINSLCRRDGLRDLLAVASYACRPEMVLIPKVESPRDIEVVASVLDDSEWTPEVWAIVETPRGIANLTSITRAVRLGGLVFGAADYARALGTAPRWTPLMYARSALATAAAAIGVPAIDSPYFAMRNLDGLRRESRLVKALGYCGKVAVHPLQVPVINTAFSPTQSEIDHARAIVSAGHASGAGVTSIDGQMVGKPFFTSAASLIGQVDDSETSSGVEMGDTR